MLPAFFALVIFEKGSCFMPGPWSSYLCFPLYLGSHSCTMIPCHWLKWGLKNFLPGLASNCDLPDLYLHTWPLLLFVCFSDRVLCFCPGHDCHTSTSQIGGTTGVPASLWGRILLTCVGWPQTWDPPISVSSVAGITGVKHHNCPQALKISNASELFERRLKYWWRVWGLD
jgi:hypothetical protein